MIHDIVSYRQIAIANVFISKCILQVQKISARWILPTLTDDKKYGYKFKRWVIAQNMF